MPVVSFRITQEEAQRVDVLVGANGCDSRGDYAKKALLEKLNGDGKIERPPVLRMPADARTRRVYEALLRMTSDEDPRLPKSDLRKAQLRAYIVSSRTFKVRLQMLQEEGFVAIKPDFIVVIRWPEKRGAGG